MTTNQKPSAQAAATDDPLLADIPPPSTPEFRAYLRRLRYPQVPALSVLQLYFALAEGDAAQREQAAEVLSCLLHGPNNYLGPVWTLAYEWKNSTHGRFDVEDLVAATAEEIAKALRISEEDGELKRASSRRVLEYGWRWFCEQCFKRARAQADLNGRDGVKAITEDCLAKAQAIITETDIPRVITYEPVSAEMAPRQAQAEATAVEHESVAYDMAAEIASWYEGDYSTYTVLERFITGYIAEVSDPERRAVAEARLRPDTTPTSGKRTTPDGRLPLIDTLTKIRGKKVSRDQVNDMIKEELLRFHAALVVASETYLDLDPDFVRSLINGA